MNQCVIILGMHRAGTSLIAKQYHKWGVDLGTKLYKSDSANLDGYYENIEFVVHNNSLMSDVKSFWNYPKLMKSVPSRGCETLVKQFTRPLWGWKDNRTVFTFPVWEPYIADQNILFIVCTRNKKSVVKSLHKTHANMFEEKDRTDEYFGNLYDLYYETIEKITQGYPTTVVRYEDMRNTTFFKKELEHFSTF